ncbi:MAG: ABC-ATPase domain-containing protein [Schaedlerella sp.]|nr:ABC-ATPase domain-containing protein [Schaedlerella sp.]
MQTAKDLKTLLDKIDHRGYPFYKDTKGEYQFQGYILSIDHVQGDPFASPSKVSIHLNGSSAGFPKEYFSGKCQRIALQDFLIRQFGKAIERYTFKAKGSGKSGLIGISRCGQEVLERTACQIDKKSGNIVLRIEVGFPANGRTINAKELIKIMFDFLPECVEQTLYYKNCAKKALQRVIELAEDQEYIRKKLSEMGMVAFVANGSVLPRESGVSFRPMKNAIAFQSPKELEVSLKLPHRGEISGMGIRKGITLIVGGGYHGKSTLLKALELGVYNHIPDDGREYVITDASAVKIRAEDGRSIKKTDISMFINDLPNEKDTKYFYTEDASGSTSQAANVVESIEAGTKLLLIDEDTSATNFMIRDELMQRVIQREMEPITPFIDRIRELYTEYGISTIIVAGSSGAYFHVADSIVQMDKYIPKEITEYAKEHAKAFPALSGIEKEAERPVFDRCPGQSKGFRVNDRIKMKIFGKESVQINRDTIDLRYVEQIADSEQVSALGYCVKYAQMHLFDGKSNLRKTVNKLEEIVEKDGISSLCENKTKVANMAMPRRQEIFACLNRYRELQL